MKEHTMELYMLPISTGYRSILWKEFEDVGEELADVAIYLLGLSEILGIDLEDEIQKKVYKNAKREYKVIDGVNTRVKEADVDFER